jgi:hypothetical protein
VAEGCYFKADAAAAKLHSCCCTPAPRTARLLLPTNATLRTDTKCPCQPQRQLQLRAAAVVLTAATTQRLPHPVMNNKLERQRPHAAASKHGTPRRYRPQHTATAANPHQPLKAPHPDEHRNQDEKKNTHTQQPNHATPTNKNQHPSPPIPPSRASPLLRHQVLARG